MKTLPATTEPTGTVDGPTRRELRYAEIPTVYKTSHERLACEIALGVEDHLAIFARHGYTPDQALALLETKEFTVMLDRVAREVREQGLPFRAKARAMAEELLPEAFAIATDELASSAVRADLIQWMARVADLEPPRKDGKEGSGGAGGLTLNITFAGQEKQTLVKHEPITIEG